MKIATLCTATLLALTLLTAQPVQAEPQPAMRAALAELKAAERNLEKATPDKGGHRKKALKLVRKAIHQVEAGLRYDNRH